MRTTQHNKWCLVVDKVDVNMPTKEHAIKLGRYLKQFNVPVGLAEITVTVETSDTGKLRIVGRERKDETQLLNNDNQQTCKSDV